MVFTPTLIIARWNITIFVYAFVCLLACFFSRIQVIVTDLNIGTQSQTHTRTHARTHAQRLYEPSATRQVRTALQYRSGVNE